MISQWTLNGSPGWMDARPWEAFLNERASRLRRVQLWPPTEKKANCLHCELLVSCHVHHLKSIVLGWTRERASVLPPIAWSAIPGKTSKYEINTVLEFFFKTLHRHAAADVPQTNWRCQISKMAVTDGYPLDSGFPVSTAVIPRFSYII